MFKKLADNIWAMLSLILFAGIFLAILYLHGGDIGATITFVFNKIIQGVYWVRDTALKIPLFTQIFGS